MGKVKKNFDDPFQRRWECMDLAIGDYVPEHRSNHWDVFGDDFHAALRRQSSWPDFMHNEISKFFELAGCPHKDLEVSDPRDRHAWSDAYDRLCSLTGKEFVKNFAEADIGNPIHLRVDGIKIHPIELHLVYYSWNISKIFESLEEQPSVIIEIGGGYGGLAAKLKKLYPNATIILFDLPETLHLQSYFLSEAYPEAKVFDYIDYLDTGMSGLVPGEHDFALLPGWTISELPSKFADLMINTRSMMEMNKGVVSFYMAEICRITQFGGLFYCVNRYEKAKVDYPIRIKEFDFDDCWYFCVDQPVWDQGPSVHEIVAVRTKLPNTYPPAYQLRNLPPVRGKDINASCRELFGLLNRRFVSTWQSTRLLLWKIFYLWPRNGFVRLFPRQFEWIKKTVMSGN